MKKYKVLMMTSLYYGELKGPIEDFNAAGCEVQFFESLPMFSKWSIFTRVKNRFGMDVSRYKRRRSQKVSSDFYKRCREYKPDIVYIVGGSQLLPEYLKKIKKHSFIVAEFQDRLQFYPELYDTIKYYDAVYTFSSEDAALICKKGGNGVYYNSYVNPKNFAKKIPVKKDIDISFIGNMYPQADYGERYKILHALIYDFPDLKFYIGGKCAPVRRPELFIRWLLHSRERKCFVNKVLTRTECNMIYNRSKICLVINRINTGDTWTDRLVNIMATGTFQLVTYTDQVDKEFKGQLDTFKSYDELKQKIEYYLSHEEIREKIADHGYKNYIYHYKKKEKESAVVDIMRRFNEWKTRRAK